jgi:hypothetical protein
MFKVILVLASLLAAISSQKLTIYKYTGNLCEKLETKEVINVGDCLTYTVLGLTSSYKFVNANENALQAQSYIDDKC